MGAGTAFSLALSLSNPAAAQATFVKNDAGNPLPPPYEPIHPRIALVDIDNDGDLDSFVGDVNGAIQYYRNDSPEDRVYRLTLVTGTGSPVNGMDFTAHAAPAFADVDGDGDFDMLVGNYYGSTYFFRNTGSRTNPVFTEQTDSSNPFDGIIGTTNKYGTSRAIPVFADIDDDNDIDLFIGSSQRGDVNGTYDAVQYFENQGTQAAPNFVSASHNIVGLDLNNIVALAFVDVDSDGDLDLFAGQEYDFIRVFRNDDGGSSFTEMTGTWDPATESGNPSPDESLPNTSPVFGDMDGDGDMDMLIGQTANFRPIMMYYENTGTFVLEARQDLNISPFGGVDVGLDAAPTFVDLDNDGDLDAVIGEKYSSGNALQVYENVNGRFIAQLDHELVDLIGPSKTNPVFADIDDDGDDDLFVGGFGIRFFDNDEGTFSSATNLFPTLNSGNTRNATVAFIDVDGDDDLDAFVGNNHSSFRGITFFRNIGSTTAPIFNPEQVPAPFNQADLFEDAPLIKTADLDRDGDLDLVVTETYYNGWYGDNYASRVRFFSNNGDGSFTEADDAVIIELTPYSLTTFADIDRDGDLDAFVGNGYSFDLNQDGRITYFENTDLSPSEGRYTVYNAVSANADDLNSYMRIEGLPVKNKVTIYNRWGDKVCEIPNYDNETHKFEGKNDNGKDLPAGTYFYAIEVKGKKQTGYLSLKR